MEWWSVFRIVRKVIFGFIASVSAIWAAVLSVYLAKEWSNFAVLQRTIVITMISVNVVTTIMQYLMMVMVFKFWSDFGRMMFLIFIHVGTAVLFTLFGSTFSCLVWDTQLICKDVDLAFLVSSWALAGLLVGYILCLCIMSQVPLPVPMITPNELLTSPSNRRESSSSFGSVSSATRLLNKEGNGSTWVDKESQMDNVHTGPGQPYIVNGAPFPVSRPASRIRSEVSYGAVGTRGTPAPSIVGVPAPSHVRQASVTSSIRSQPQAFGQKRFSRPAPLPLPNPFLDPISRNGTPHSTFSVLTFNSSGQGYRAHTPGAESLHSVGYPPPSYQVPPPLTGIQEVPLSSDSSDSSSQRSPESPSSIYSLYSSETDTPATSFTSVSYSSPYDQDSPSLKRTGTISTPDRTHTATSHSIHSIAPSVHFHQPENRPPPAVHLRAASDPVDHRSYTASPRLVHLHPSPEDNIDLPNPFPMVGAEVRRYASTSATSTPSIVYAAPPAFPKSPSTRKPVARKPIPEHIKAAYHQRGISQNSYVRAVNVTNGVKNERNAAHLQAALGRTPPRAMILPAQQMQRQMQNQAQAQAQPVVYKPARGATTMDRGQWKQLVMNAASTRS